MRWISVLILFWSYSWSKADDQPVFVSQAGVHDGMKGQEIILPCKLNSANLEYAVVWQKLDENSDQEPQMLFAERQRVVDNDRLEYVRPDDAANWDIRIKNLAAFQDDGVYECQLSTEPVMSQRQTLNVKSAPIVSIFPEKSPFSVEVGANITLTCQGTGNPKPSIVWTKTDGPLPQGIQNSGQLFYRSASDQHQGTYRCTAENGVGEPVHSDIVVQIIYSPKVTAQSKILNVKLSESFNVTCSYSANPLPNVEWFFNGYKIETNENDRVKIVQFRKNDSPASSIMISDARPEDYGAYTCRVVNNLGQAEASTLVTDGMPDKPQIFQDFIRDNAISLHWSVLSKEPILEYQLDYKRLEDATSSVKSTIIPVMSHARPTVGDTYEEKYSMEHLLPESSYEVTIKARNSVGWGKVGMEIFKTDRIQASKQQSDSIGVSDSSTSSAHDKFSTLNFALVMTLSPFFTYLLPEFRRVL